MEVDQNQIDRIGKVYNSEKKIEDRIAELARTNQTIYSILTQFRDKKEKDKQAALSEYVPNQVVGMEIMKRQIETEIFHLKALRRAENPTIGQRLENLKTKNNSTLLDPWGTLSNLK